MMLMAGPNFFTHYKELESKIVSYNGVEEISLELINPFDINYVKLNVTLSNKNTYSKIFRIKEKEHLGLYNFLENYNVNTTNLKLTSFPFTINDNRLKKSLKYLDADGLKPNSKNIYSDHFDIVFDTVGLEATRKQAIESIKPGGIIIHIGLTQPSGNFDFRKTTLQEITFIGTYCYTNEDFKKTLNILSNREIGSLDWIEYRKLKEGSTAFKEIHEGKCTAPKIVLLT